MTEKKKMLLTGASSFLGAQLASFFSQKYNVTCSLSKNFNTYGGEEKERLNFIKNKVQFCHLDLQNTSLVKEVIADLQPNFFIHHAGYATDYASDKFDLEFGRKINVDPLEVIFKSLQDCGKCEKIISTGTSMEYADSESLLEESDKRIPPTKYGQLKREQTDLSLELSDKTHIPLVVARVFNPTGHLDKKGKLIPFVMNKLLNEEKVELSKCSQVRDIHHFTHVLNSYDLLLGNPSATGIYNISLGECISLKEVLHFICDYLKRDKSLLKFGVKQMRVGEPPKIIGSTRKLISAGGVIPGIEEQLTKVIEDFRLNI